MGIAPKLFLQGSNPLIASSQVPRNRSQIRSGKARAASRVNSYSFSAVQPPRQDVPAEHCLQSLVKLRLDLPGARRSQLWPGVFPPVFPEHSKKLFACPKNLLDIRFQEEYQCQQCSRENVYRETRIVWCEPESCVKDDLNGAGTARIESFGGSGNGSKPHFYGPKPRIASEAKVQSRSRHIRWRFHAGARLSA